MASKDRFNSLLSLIYFTKHPEIKVTSIRDQILSTTDAAEDPNILRRWVAGQCETFVRRGWLTKHAVSNSKKKHYFALTQKFREFYEQSNVGAKTDDIPAKNERRRENTLKQIEDELNQCRRTVVSQLSEIAEYERIRESYPELSGLATSQFAEVLDENYRLLGRVKALENVLAHSGRDT